MKLEIYSSLQDTTPHAKFQGATSTWVVWRTKYVYFLCTAMGPSLVFCHYHSSSWLSRPASKWPTLRQVGHS